MDACQFNPRSRRSPEIKLFKTFIDFTLLAQFSLCFWQYFVRVTQRVNLSIGRRVRRAKLGHWSEVFPKASCAAKGREGRE